MNFGSNSATGAITLSGQLTSAANTHGACMLALGTSDDHGDALQHRDSQQLRRRYSSSRAKGILAIGVTNQQIPIRSLAPEM